MHPESMPSFLSKIFSKRDLQHQQRKPTTDDQSRANDWYEFCQAIPFRDIFNQFVWPIDDDNIICGRTTVVETSRFSSAKKCPLCLFFKEACKDGNGYCLAVFESSDLLQKPPDYRIVRDHQNPRTSEPYDRCPRAYSGQAVGLLSERERERIRRYEGPSGDTRDERFQAKKREVYQPFISSHLLLPLGRNRRRLTLASLIHAQAINLATPDWLLLQSALDQCHSIHSYGQSCSPKNL